MLPGLIQFLLVSSIITLAAALVALFVFGCNYVFTGKNARRLLLPGFFVLGALVSGFVGWRVVPPEWSLSFWTTLEATVDAEKYGHAIEHYAEGVVMMMTFAALLGGCASAGAAALGARILRKTAHT